MLWARSRTTEIYLGGRSVGFKMTNEPATWLDVNSALDAVQDLAQLLGKPNHSTGRVRIWLSASLAVPFVIPSDCGARSRLEAEEIARSMATQVANLDAEPYTWMDRWRRDHPTSAVAMSAALRAELQEICRKADTRLFSLRPWWNGVIAAMKLAQPNSNSEYAWALAEPDGLTFGWERNGRFEVLSSAPVLDHDPNWVNFVRRITMGWSANTELIHLRAELKNNLSAPSIFPIGGLSSPKSAISVSDIQDAGRKNDR